MLAANSRGFTLIELLVVLIVVGLLSSLVVPAGFKQIASYEQASQTESLRQTVQNSVREAYLRNKDFILRFNQDILQVEVDGRIERLVRFDQLRFGEQNLHVNRKGVADACRMPLFEDAELEQFYWLNFDTPRCVPREDEKNEGLYEI